MKTIRPQTLGSLILGLALVGQSVADELPPGLEQAIQNPGIPMILDATILKFNKEGHAEIRVNHVYKPSRVSGRPVKPPSIVRGYASVGKVTRIVPINIITDKGKTRFLFFLDGNLLYSTYNNRFEIKEDRKGQLSVHTGRSWKPLAEIVKLIPKASPLKKE